MSSFKRIIFYLIWISSIPSYAIVYNDYKHTNSEILQDQAIVFSGHTLGYLLTQRETIQKEGSLDNYKNNFLQFRFDNDNTNWNIFGHTYTGAQVYLYYRARGYNRNKSFLLSFLSSLWFEVFIENYTEKPSIQDTFNTPILGSSLGYFFEGASKSLINSSNPLLKILGRAINPMSFFIDERKISVIPVVEGNDHYALQVRYFYD